MKVSEKTTGELIDQLITTSLKCWFSQDEIQDMSLTDEQRLRSAERAQQTNAQRNKLIRAINERLGEGEFSPLEKTYD